MTFGGIGVRGCWLCVGAPSTHSMSGLSLARHVDGIVGHMHWSNFCVECVVLGSGVMVACVDKCVISRMFI